MPFQHKPDSGSLFRNERRENENQPTHTGSALVDGIEYWISAWTNDTSGGKKFFGMKFRRKDNQPSTGSDAKPPPADPKDFDDDIPF